MSPPRVPRVDRNGITSKYARTVALVFACVPFVLFVAFGAVPFDGHDFAGNVYGATRAVWAGADPYVPSAFAQVLREACPKTPPYPFGYPPWFVASTLWLGLLPVDAAGRLWMVVNLAIALGIGAVLAVRRSSSTRISSLLAAVLYIPSMCVIFVGQYTLPTALGAALLVHAARGGPALAGGAGLALLAFKPHVGAFVALAAVPWLLRRGRRALLIGLGIGAALLLASFVVSRSWPTSYPASALALFADPVNAACDTCSSLMGVLLRRFPGRVPIVPSLLVAGALLALVGHRRPPPVQISLGVVVALLASPYLRSYDYVMLLVPMFVAWERSSEAGRIAIAVAWALAVVIMVTTRDAGVHALWSSAVLVGLVIVGRRRASELPTESHVLLADGALLGASGAGAAASYTPANCTPSNTSVGVRDDEKR